METTPESRPTSRSGVMVAAFSTLFFLAACATDVPNLPPIEVTPEVPEEPDSGAVFDTRDTFIDATRKLQKDGAKQFILDLRSCAIGTPEDGIALANLFLNKGRITYLVGQKVARQNFEADPAKAITTLPMTVLTNRGTADGAEIAAAAQIGRLVDLLFPVEDRRK